MNKILAAVITFHPNRADLERLVARLLPQVAQLVIIDNATPMLDLQQLSVISPRIECIRNPDNLGLATAYNRACAIAAEKGCSHIILFDQDSLPAPDMVQILSDTLHLHNRHALTVAAAGPNYGDIKGQHSSPFVRIKRLHLERVECRSNDVVEVDHLISSGCLIDLRALAQVGTFMDCLFIDCIDTEWCLRARQQQLILLGVGSALMTHSIGEQQLQILGRTLPMHNPMRLQYQFRNQVWLLRQPHIRWRWKVIDAIRCMKLIAVYCVFVPNKRDNLRAIMIGIKRALTGNMGKITSH